MGEIKKYLKKIAVLNCIIYRNIFREKKYKTEEFYMKNIFKGTIIFAVCLTLAACGTGARE
ncbi:MAG: hypothetical protein K2G04_04505, partial [Oscillospiraceae bacterium]|nr:hypothetical protein [Oscillospiraceae bacterium]